MFNSLHERLKFLRELSGFTRKEMEEKYGVNAHTLRGWEIGRFPISEGGLKQCIDIYNKIGINVTEEWLKQGIGTPIFKKDNNMTLYVIPNSTSIDTKNSEMINDIEYLKKYYQDILIYFITSEDMLPVYKVGDFVAGIATDLNADFIQNLNNSECIVQLENNDLLFKKILVNSVSNEISLISLDPSKSNSPIINNVNIKKIAPLIFHRIKN
ncbi:MAG: helix-turn-helix transcriptional regulator [Sphingobacteriia bacterium]|nr:helix-turn-helix transcriptional regulator [Sphingobacteriia bacterium]